MIIHLTGAERDRYPGIFREMHRQRHETYVVERGWKALRSWQGEERDRFDRTDAQYILCLGEDGVAGALRLLPTTKPHLISEVFPHFVDSGSALAGPTVAELTRFYVAPRERRAGRSREIVGKLSLGLFEHAREVGLTGIVSIVDAFLVPRMRAWHWPFRPIGPRLHYGEGLAVAVAIIPDMLTVRTLREKVARGHRRRASNALVPAGVAAPWQRCLDLVSTEP